MPSTFAPLKNRSLRRYLIAQGISMTGNWMQNAAAAWLVWRLSHSAASLGILVTLGLAPFFFLAPWTGVWADRINRRSLLRVTQTAAMLLAFALAALVATDVVRLWHVYAFAVLFGSVAALDLPSHQAFLGDLSGIDAVRETLIVEKIVFQLSRLVGPPIAGFLIGWVGMASVFWLNGLSFLAVIGVLTKVSTQQIHLLRQKTSFHEFVESLRFLRDHVKVQYLFAFSIFVAFLGFPSQQMLAAFVSDILHRGPGALGLLMGASGLGAFFGSLVVAPLANRIPRTGVMLAGACIWTGFCFLVLSCSTSLSLSLVSMAGASVTMPVVMVTSSVFMQTLSADGMRARMVSVWMMITYGVQPVATLLVGCYAGWAGVATAIGLNGALMIAGPIVLHAGSRELRRWVR